MRFLARISVVVCALVVVASESTFANTINVAGFVPERVFRSFGGPDYDNIWGRLSDPANFGPGGIVPHSVVLQAPRSVATSETLAGLDIFIMSEVFTPLSPDEAAAIAGFVRDGGCLLVVADTLHASNPPGGNGTVPGNMVLSLLDGTTIDPFDLTGPQTATAGRITGLVSPLTDGPFGSFNLGDTFGASWHTPLTMGNAAQAVGDRNGSTILGYIPEGALGEGSGSVLIAGDILFSDYFVPPGANGGATESEANPTLFMNFVAGCDCYVPEPSTLAMFVVAAVAFAPLSVRRRRDLR